jgi:phytoene dehydrogenase-like protein
MFDSWCCIIYKTAQQFATGLGLRALLYNNNYILLIIIIIIIIIYEVGAARELALGALERAGCEHIREDVESEAVLDPLEWRARYGLRRGAVFGLSHGLAQLSVFRPSQATGRVAGLFFVGASTQPGNGVPLVLISAEQVARRVLRHIS